MNQDEIIEMAKEAGFWQDLSVYEGLREHFKAFSKLVAAKERKECAEQYLRIMRNAVKDAVEIEREACAKVCDRHKLPDQLVHNNAVMGCRNAIRARGEA